MASTEVIIADRFTACGNVPLSSIITRLILGEKPPDITAWVVTSSELTIEYHGPSSLSEGEELPFTLDVFANGETKKKNFMQEKVQIWLF